eukprot:COSAG02_NODE_17635_length_990_cov_0.920314_2_plen_50_part_01
MLRIKCMCICAYDSSPPSGRAGSAPSSEVTTIDTSQSSDDGDASDVVRPA